MHGDDFVCLSDDEGLKHIDKPLTSKYTAKDMGTHGFEDSDAKSLLLLNRVFRVGTDDRGQHLDMEPDLRHHLSSLMNRDATQRPSQRLRHERNFKTRW